MYLGCLYLIAIGINYGNQSMIIEVVLEGRQELVLLELQGQVECRGSGSLAGQRLGKLTLDKVRGVGVGLLSLLFFLFPFLLLLHVSLRMFVCRFVGVKSINRM